MSFNPFDPDLDFPTRIIRSKTVSDPRSISWQKHKQRSSSELWQEEIEKLHGQIHEHLIGFKMQIQNRVNEKVINHEKELVQKFEVYTNKMHEQIRQYRSKLEAAETAIEENRVIKELQQELDDNKQTLMQARKNNASLKKQIISYKLKEKWLKDEVEHMREQLAYIKRKNIKVDLAAAQPLSSPYQSSPTYHQLPPTRASPSPPATERLASPLRPRRQSPTLYQRQHLTSPYNYRDMTSSVAILPNSPLSQKKTSAPLQRASPSPQNTNRRVTNTGNKQFQRSELEEIFHQCVQEVHQSVIRRRGTRSTSSKLPVKFMPFDKKQLLEKFVTNETVVALWNEHMFPKAVAEPQATQV